MRHPPKRTAMYVSLLLLGSCFVSDQMIWLGRMWAQGSAIPLGLWLVSILVFAARRGTRRNEREDLWLPE